MAVKDGTAGVGLTPNREQAGRWVITAAVLASSMAFIDSTALNVALPALQHDLGASATGLLWIVNGYTVMLAALLLVGGALGDRYGRRRILMLGICLFAGASALCGAAPNTAVLIVARAIQGTGGALMTPGSLAIISASFDDQRRGAAIGTWSAWSTLTTLAGPVIGGVLAGNGLWRAVFFINLPLAVVALVILQRKVPESRSEEVRGRLDYVGAALVTLGLLGISYGCLIVPNSGWGNPVTLVSLFGGIVALVVFVLVERRTAHPLMPVELFRSRTFSGSNLLTLMLYGALAATSFFIPLNLIQVQGYSATQAGLAGLPVAILLAVISRTSGAWADRVGPRLPLTIGPGLVGIGFWLYGLPGLTAGPAAYWTTFFPGIVVVGFGLGITVAPLTTAVMGAVSQRFAGVASGVNNAVARSANVLAIAVLGALAILAFQAQLLGQTHALNLGPEALAALRVQAGNLGGAQVPPGLEPATSRAIATAIPLAFVTTFRQTVHVAAGMAWLSALLAWLTIVPGQQATR